MCKKKVKSDIALSVGNPTSELRDVTCQVGAHSVTCYPTQVNAPHLTPACMLVLDLLTPEGWKAEWIYVVDLIARRPGVELATFRSRVRRPNTAPTRHIAPKNCEIMCGKSSLVHYVRYLLPECAMCYQCRAKLSA